jgi:hypothetical protein
MFLIERYVREFQATYAALMARPAGEYGWRSVRWPRAYNDWIRSAVNRRLGRVSPPSVQRLGALEVDESAPRISALR